MSKKPSKAKAKRPRAIVRPRTLKEFQLDIFGGRKLASRRPAPTKAEQAASAEFQRKAAEYFASEEFRQFKARDAAARARHRERIERRPAEMRSRSYRLSTDVITFLLKLHRNPLDVGLSVPEQVPGDDAKKLIDDAYMEGCRQGFIEGFLYGEDKARPGALKNRERLRAQNIKKLERLGIADRNAKIVAEFHRLERELPGKEQRKEKLAADHDLTPKQIGNILRACKRR